MNSQTKAIDLVNASLKRRYAKERRFQLIGLGAVLLGLLFVLFLFVSIAGNGYTAFQQTRVQLEIHFSQEALDPSGERDLQVLSTANYSGLIKSVLREHFPEVKKRRDKKSLYKLMSSAAPLILREMVLNDLSLIGSTQRIWLPVDDDIDMLIKGHIDRQVPESERRVSNRIIGWVEQWESQGLIEKHFNFTFLTGGDSREPEQAGIGGAVMGSIYTLIVTLLLSFPIGVSAAIYLEEFAPKNRWIDMVEVNINNLAAVPSIVFGLLGLAVFINFFGLPRSAPLVGGLVLTLMTLPTIIIASRAALKAVPPSIREAALGVGASKMQTVFQHVFPLAMPGMLTGTIIGMAQALGESAPLLMIGMVAFIVDIPGGPLDPIKLRSFNTISRNISGAALLVSL